MSYSSVPREHSVHLDVEALEARSLPSSSQCVTALYADLLHRAPAAAEITPWVTALDTGVPAAQVADSITRSVEFQTNLIQTSYAQFLNRQPTPAEVAGWLGQLQAGLGELQLEAKFLASDEFFQLHGGTNQGWLNGVYQKVLGRAPDAAGLNSWSQILQNETSREQVALNIVTSTEALDRLVNDAYQALLGRPADPAGLAHWVGLIQAGMDPSQFLVQLVNSSEFINKQGGLDQITPLVPVPVFVPVDTFVPPFFIGMGGFGGFTTVGFTGGGFTGGGFSGSGSGF